MEAVENEDFVNKKDRPKKHNFVSWIPMCIVFALIAIMIPVTKNFSHIPQVGAGFAARTVCSGVFISNRSLQSLKDNELEGIAGLFYFTLEEQGASASLFGLGFAKKTARFISPALGCRLVDSTDASSSNASISLMAVHALHTNKIGSAPSTQITNRYENKCCDGNVKGTNAKLESWLDTQFTPEAHADNQSRAIVVLHKGKVIGERYNSFISTLSKGQGLAGQNNLNPGRKDNEGVIDCNTKLLGWSMTKSVQALIIGAAEQAGILGELGIRRAVKLIDFTQDERDRIYHLNGNRNVTFADLLQMVDILRISENYAIHNGDIPKMLYTATDFSKHCSDSAYFTRMPSEEYSLHSTSTARGTGTLGYNYNALWNHVRGKAYKEEEMDKKKNMDVQHLGWYYNSGLTNILAKEFRLLFSDDDAYYNFPHTHLFHPLGIDSFTIETDGIGTFVASSYGYATARDWAKLGQLLLNNGRSKSIYDTSEGEGKQILSETFIKWALTPHGNSGGLYGGSIWLNPSVVDVPAYNALPFNSPNKQRYRWITKVLPSDAFGFNGFMGQMVVGIPSLDLVVVRIGFTKADVDPTASDLEKKGQVPWNRATFFTELLEAIAQN